MTYEEFCTAEAGDAADTGVAREAVEETRCRVPAVRGSTPEINSPARGFGRAATSCRHRVISWTRSPVEVLFVRARKRWGSYLYGWASARSHQMLPKLTNGPSSVEIRVRTW